jgi:uncharacterized membrane protein YgcG
MIRRFNAYAALAAVAVLAAGCASHEPRPSGKCQAEWHPPVEMLTRYAEKNGNVTRADMEAGLRKDFDAADTNHNGVLDKDEIRAVNEQRWNEDKSATSPLVDLDGSGVITFDEFAGTARSLFDQLDTKGTGVLTAQQLKAMQCAPRSRGGEGEQDEGRPGGHRRGGGRGGGGGGGNDGGGDDGDGPN